MKHHSSVSLAAVAATAMVLSVPAFAQDMMSEDTMMTDSGDVTIYPIHHASTRLTWNDVDILVDPAPPPGSDGEGDVTAEYTAMPSPNLILVTHEHGDHYNAGILQAVSDGARIVAPQAVADQMPDDLKEKTTVLANGESTTVEGIEIEAIPAYNITEDRLQYHPEGRDNGYVLTLGGTRVYFAGDTEDIPEMRALENIDAAFVPMNLPYTMTVDAAADAVNEFQPDVVYPYHYGESDVEAFASMVSGPTEVRRLEWY